MFVEQFKKMKTQQGFIAALDQSGGSTPKALKLYGVDESEYHGDEEMFNKVHEMRTRIITNPHFTGEKIVGAILLRIHSITLLMDYLALVFYGKESRLYHS